MDSLASWIRATRPLAQANLAIPLALGQAAAYHAHGTFDLGLAILIHLFGLADHLFIVFANDHADRHTDDGRTTPISGGSGVLVSGRIRPESLRRAAIAAGVVAVLLTLPLVVLRPLLVFAAPAAIGLLLAYSYPPLDLSRRGGGEWLQALGVGVGLPGFAFYVQSGDASPPAAVLVPSFLLAFVGHVLTALPDEASDRRAGKRTVVVRVGAERSARIALVLALASIPLVVRACGSPDETEVVRLAMLTALLVPPFAFLVRSSRRESTPFRAIFAALVAVELVLVVFVAWLAGMDLP